MSDAAGVCWPSPNMRMLCKPRKLPASGGGALGKDCQGMQHSSSFQLFITERQNSHIVHQCLKYAECAEIIIDGCSPSSEALVYILEPVLPRAVSYGIPRVLVGLYRNRSRRKRPGSPSPNSTSIWKRILLLMELLPKLAAGNLPREALRLADKHL